MFPLCRQPQTLEAISCPYRWFIFLTGLLEVCVWSGIIFGWASAVHVFKTYGIYNHLCHNETITVNLTDKEGTEEFPKTTEKVILNCDEQDERFALVGTISMVLYTVPGIVVGYALHYWGLASTRILGTSIIALGFILLAATTEEQPGFLWGATLMLSMGGNTLRVACLEFANLFPSHRYTALSVISGSFTVSAALFFIVQIATEAGSSWTSICYSLVGMSSLSAVITIFMPRKHIPYRCPEADGRESESSLSSDENEIYSSDDSLGQPLTMSLLSLSSGLHFLWFFNSVFTAHIFGIAFNYWITSISESDSEVATYSRHYGIANILCFVAIPLPGLIVDALTVKLKEGKVGPDTRIARIQATIVPLLIVCVFTVVQLSCMYSRSSWAVYLSLFCLTINRPSCWVVAAIFMRARFPVDHFNRLVGFYGTSLAILSLMQWVLFKWLQKQFFMAITFLLVMVSTSFIHPLFLLRKSQLRRVIIELHRKQHYHPLE